MSDETQHPAVVAAKGAAGRMDRDYSCEDNEIWALHFEPIIRAAYVPRMEAMRELLEAAKTIVEIDRRDELTDPDMSATDEYRDESKATLRDAIAKAEASIGSKRKKEPE